jgi:PKD repeat protein
MNDPIEWHWYFEGGDPEESAEQHPKVLYENPGKYDVKLIVTNEHGSDSLLISNYITVKMLPPDADFEADVTIIEEGESVTFTNLSQQKHPTTYSWFFQGGTPEESDQENPPAIFYIKAGTYPVRLTAKNEGDKTIEQKDDYITVTPKVAITDISTGSIVIYPNPTGGQLKIENGELKIENVDVYDVFGRNVLSHQLSTFNFQLSTQIDISSLPSGVYFVRIKTEEGIVTKKMVKN